MLWNSLAFFSNVRSERVEHWIQVLERQQRSQAHGGGENIVGGLTVVHVVVGMNVGVLAELAAENFVGAIGDDLVGVHVEADAGAGLKNIDQKFLIPLAVDDFLRSLRDGVGTMRVDQAEFFVGLCGGTLDQAKSSNEQESGRACRRWDSCGQHAPFAHRNRPAREPQCSQRIFFFPRFGHDDLFPLEPRPVHF